MSVDPRSLIERATAPIQLGVTVDMTGLKIESSLDFGGKTLGNIDFSGSVFSRAVTFRGAVLSGLAWFRGCRFDGPVDLSGAIFHNDLRMDGCAFSSSLMASRAEFRGIAAFDRAVFGDLAAFDHLTAFGNVSLDHASFDGSVSFQNSECLGGFWAEGTRFRRKPDFRGLEVHGRTWLRNLEGEKPPSSLRDVTRFGLLWT